MNTLNNFKQDKLNILQSRILHIASASFHTAVKPGTFMTKGRRKIEQLKYHLKVYVDHYHQWEESQRMRYWCCAVGSRQRYAPPHVLQEYCRKGRSFAIATFNEPTLSYSIDEKEVVAGCGGVVLPLAGETRDKNLIKNLLFLVGDDSGLGFGFGLIRVSMSSAISRSYVSPSTMDLEAISTLCQVRSQDDLDELITDLYRKVPLSTDSATRHEEPTSSSSCTIC